MPTVPTLTDTAMQGDTELRERWLLTVKQQQKKVFFSRSDGTQVWLWSIFLESSEITERAGRGQSLLWISCVKCSFVWFCLCCFLCLQWSKRPPTFLSHVSFYQVVSPQYCYYSVTMVYYITLNIVIECCFFFSCRNIVWQQCNCAWEKKKKILACKEFE